LSTCGPHVRQGELEALRQRPTSVLNDHLQLAALTNLPVLITAERRDQRETCARLIHTNGNTRQGPFSAFSDRVPGAIPGDARSSRAPRPHGGIGLRHQFDAARGGTLFIDDIASLTPDVQAQLLCLLEVSLVSGPTVDAGSLRVRVIAGASRHLELERATGAFCESLFYRLNVVHIYLLSGDATTNLDSVAPVHKA
jgi:DNA-binding NtrC family response regulator